MSGSSPLRTAFLGAAGHEASLRPQEGLVAVLRGWVEAGRAAWPDFVLSDTAFVACVARRLHTTDPEALRALHAADLFLTCACLHGDPNAVQVLIDSYIGPLRGLLRRRLHSPDLVEDVIQSLTADLLVVATNDRVPKLATYRGRGPLRGWLNAVGMNRALRVAQNLARSPVDGDEESLLAEASIEHDPELRTLKASSRDTLVAAFKAAMAELPDRDKTILRQYYVDGVRIDKLAQLNRVHRVTMSRRIARAREVALETTRACLADRFAMGDTECDSLIRFARSQLEVTQGLLE